MHELVMPTMVQAAGRALATRRRRRGRRPRSRGGEAANKKVTIRFTTHEFTRLRAAAGRTPVAEFIRSRTAPHVDAVLFAYEAVGGAR